MNAKKTLVMIMAVCMLFALSATALADPLFDPEDPTAIVADLRATHADGEHEGGKHNTILATKTANIDGDHITGSLTDGVMAGEGENNDGRQGTVPVLLRAEGLTFSVTVPTNLPIYVNKEGKVYTATTNTITNNGYGPVVVTDVTVQDYDASARPGYFTMVDYDSTNDLQDEKIGANKFSIKVDDCEVSAADGAVELSDKRMGPNDNSGATHGTDADKPTINFSYTAFVSPQAYQVADARIAEVVITVAWDVVAGA